MTDTQKKISGTQRGFALLLAMIVASVVLAIGIAILHVSVNELDLSSTSRESEIAFQAAHAGLDCMEYWRNVDAQEFATSSLTAAPNISCFGGSAQSGEGHHYLETNGYANEFLYNFNWGDDYARCTAVEMWVFKAESGDTYYNFTQYPTVGNDGIVTCEQSNTCTVIFSRGYNRSCDDLDSSIFSVQREIVTQF